MEGVRPCWGVASRGEGPEGEGAPRTKVWQGSRCKVLGCGCSLRSLETLATCPGSLPPSTAPGPIRGTRTSSATATTTSSSARRTSPTPSPTSCPGVLSGFCSGCVARMSHRALVLTPAPRDPDPHLEPQHSKFKVRIPKLDTCKA